MTQSLTKFQKAIRLYHTVKYLKPIQIYTRFKRKIIRPKISNVAYPPQQRSFGSNPVFLFKGECLNNKNEACFLGETHVLTSNVWNDAQIEKLWLYNLHYFDDLNSESWEEKKERHKNLITRWIEENPIGYGNGWEAYPSSLRIVNWIKYLHKNTEIESKIRESLASQINYLIQNLEYHLLGNHLLANAKALVFAGLNFGGEQGDKWLAFGVELYQKELAEQVLADGGNFELSPMYHSTLLEDLLDLNSLFLACKSKEIKGTPKVFFESLPQIILSMFTWLEAMTHPDGKISFFNDAAFNIAPTYKMLKGFACKLGHSIKDTKYRCKDLKESGYIRVNQEEVSVIIDAAIVGPDYIPGHAHADTLSFELSIGKQRVFVNSGTSQYGTGAERERQRGSSAHNCLLLNQHNSSEVWGGFRVARRAKVVGRKVEEKKEEIVVTATHDGYQTIYDLGNHERQWSFKNGAMEIKDTVRGNRKGEIECRFHLHPLIVVEKMPENNKYTLSYQKKELGVFTLDSKLTSEMRDTTYHPEFGKSEETKVIVGRAKLKPEQTLQTLFTWN